MTESLPVKTPRRLASVVQTIAQMFGVGRRRKTSQQGVNFQILRGQRPKWAEVPVAFSVREMPVRDPENLLLYAQMDEYLSFVRVALDMVSEDAVTDDTGQVRGFWIETGSDELDDVINSCVAVKRLAEDGARFLRTAIKYGDAFLEHIYLPNNPSLGLIGLKEIYTGEMFRIEDFYGHVIRFEQGARGSNAQPIVFHPSLINHIRVNPSATSPYGVSWLHPIRNDFKLWMQAVEDSYVAARTRAPQRKKHIFKQWVQEWIETYRQFHRQQVWENIDTDYYVSEDRVDVEVLPGDAQVIRAFLVREEWIEQRMKIALKVPNLIIGYDTEIRGRDVSLTAERAYLRRLNSLRALYSRAVLFTTFVHLALVEKKFSDLESLGMFNGHGDYLYALTSDGVRSTRYGDAVVFASTFNQSLPQKFLKILNSIRIMWPIISIESAKDKTQRLAVAVKELGLSQATALEELGYNPERELKNH